MPIKLKELYVFESNVEFLYTYKRTNIPKRARDVYPWFRKKFSYWPITDMRLEQVVDDDSTKIVEKL